MASLGPFYSGELRALSTYLGPASGTVVPPSLERPLWFLAVSQWGVDPSPSREDTITNSGLISISVGSDSLYKVCNKFRAVVSCSPLLPVPSGVSPVGARILGTPFDFVFSSVCLTTSLGFSAVAATRSKWSFTVLVPVRPLPTRGSGALNSSLSFGGSATISAGASMSLQKVDAPAPALGLCLWGPR